MLVALRPPVRFNRVKPPSGAEFAFLEKRLTPRTVFLEIGGDTDLALQAAGYVERVYAVDVSGQLLRSVLMPCNLRLVLCDGVRIPVPEASVDLAWSGAFVDHLSAGNARDHLRNVLRALAPAGQYLLTTRDPAGLRRRLLEAGFSRVSCYLGAVPIPWALRSLAPQKLLRISAIK